MKKKTVILILIGCVGVVIVWFKITRAIQIREIDAVLREFAAALSSKDYEKARRYCSLDFEAWADSGSILYRPGHPEDIRGTSEKNLDFVATALAKLPAKNRAVLQSGHDGIVRYFPDAAGFISYSGFYYEFRKEDGLWKFSGMNGFMN